MEEEVEEIFKILKEDANYNAPSFTVEQAKQIAETFWGSKGVKGKSRHGLAGASIYLACEACACPIPQKQAKKASGDEPSFRFFLETLRHELKQYYPGSPGHWKKGIFKRLSNLKQIETVSKPYYGVKWERKNSASLYVYDWSWVQRRKTDYRITGFGFHYNVTRKKTTDKPFFNEEQMEGIKRNFDIYCKLFERKDFKFAFMGRPSRFIALALLYLSSMRMEEVNEFSSSRLTQREITELFFLHSVTIRTYVFKIIKLLREKNLSHLVPSDYA